MKRLILVPFLIIAACIPTNRFVRVAKKVMPSVVRIECMSVVNGATRISLGTGVVITSNGHILTCAHVVNKPFLIRVAFKDRTGAFWASVVRRDKVRDLALLQLSGVPPAHYVSLATFMPEVGEEVVAIGHPYDLDWSVTSGIISGLGREGLAINLLQTDTAINPGNSGGPLLNLQGELVGVNESIAVGANGLGFAVSIDEIKNFLSIFKGLDQAA